MKRLYVAAYHQSRFGKLMDMTVPTIVREAVEGVCGEIDVPPSALDVGSIDHVIAARRLRPYLIEAVERGMKRDGVLPHAAQG